MTNKPKRKQQITDYDPNPVYIGDDAAADDDLAGLNIALDAEAAASDDAERSWFFIHCYSGYEKKVEHALAAAHCQHGDARSDL